MSEYFLQIECESPQCHTCERCGDDFVRLTRFVYKNHDVFAYYYAHIEPKSHQDFIKCLIVICEFDDDNEIIHKIGFPAVLWNNDGVIATTLLNADEIPWQDIADMEILNRESALIHHHKAEVFRICDEMM